MNFNIFAFQISNFQFTKINKNRIFLSLKNSCLSKILKCRNNLNLLENLALKNNNNYIKNYEKDTDS